MKRASVYLRKTAIYLHSESETIEGAWVASAPFIKVEMDASDIGNRLELAVTTVLVNSSHEVGIDLRKRTGGSRGGIAGSPSNRRA